MQGKASRFQPSGFRSSSLIAVFTATLVSLLLSACGASKYPVVGAITFPDSQGQQISSLVQGTTLSLSALVTNDPKTLGLDWSAVCTSTGPSGCGTFGPTHTASGAITTYTGPAYPPTGGKVTIVATATQDPTRTSSVDLTITGPPITMVMQPTTATVVVNATSQFTATVANDPSGAGVNWTLTCASGGTLCGTVSPLQTDSGSATIYSAPADVPSGAVTLTATSVTDTTKTVTAQITVISPPPLTIAFAQTPPMTLQSSGQTILTANVMNDSANAGVDWTITCQSTGACGTLTTAHTASAQANQYTAPAAIPTGGNVTITATSTATPSQHVTATIQIVKATLSVSVSPKTASLMPSATASFTATVTGDSKSGGVTWAATAGTFTASQTASGSATTYTAPATIPSGGTVTITAASVTDPTSVGTATVTISSNQAISVTLNPASATVQAGATTQFTATVSGDSSSSGVNWTVTSGTISPGQTANGSASTYTAPSTVPTGGTATITATSVADPSKSATATATITTVPAGSNALLNGTYAFSLRGYNTPSSPNLGFYVLAGSITTDGNGNIISGELDSNSGTVQQAHQLTFTGTYTIDASGHGTLKFSDAVGGGDQTLSVSIANSSTSPTPATHALLQSANAETLTGTLDLQNPNAFTTPMTGNYSFNMLETAPFPAARIPCNLGGVMTIGSGTITNLILDSNQGGVVTSTTATLTASLGSPDGQGRGTLDLSSSGILPSCSAGQFVYYVVDAGHIILLDQANPGLGDAYVQPAALPTSLAGKYAFTDYGFTAGASVASTIAAGGLFTCDNTGNLTAGTLDVNNAGNFTTGAIIGTCKQDNPLSGRAVITIAHGGSGGIKKFAAYSAANGKLLLLGLDGSESGVGTAYLQGVGVNVASFNGNYSGLLQAYTQNGEEALIGSVTASGITALTGTVDVNTFIYNSFADGQFHASEALTGQSLTDTGGGRLTGTISTADTGSMQQVFYLIDAGDVLSLQSDSNPGTGILQLQNLPKP